MSFEELFDKYKLKISGILHVGAHTCEEKENYNKCGIEDKNIIWIEGNEYFVRKMKSKKYNIKNMYHAVISDKEEIVDFIITNNYQSSSILELKEHLKEHPKIKEVSRIKQKTTTIKKFINDNKITIQFNYLHLDIQGAELRALTGMEDMLNDIDYIYCEVNEKYLYEGCALVDEIDTYLKTFNFKRVETNMTTHGWGDALYIKNF